MRHIDNITLNFKNCHRFNYFIHNILKIDDDNDEEGRYDRRINLLVLLQYYRMERLEYVEHLFSSFQEHLFPRMNQVEFLSSARQLSLTNLQSNFNEVWIEFNNWFSFDFFVRMFPIDLILI